MSRRSASPKRDAITRVELLVVLVFVALGGGVLVAAASRAREAADRLSTQDKLRVLALGTVNCADTHNEKLPPGRSNYYPGNMLAPNNGYGSCLFHLLPFIEQKPLYQGSLEAGGQSPIFASWMAAGKPVSLFIADDDPTADPRSDRTSFLANALALPWTGGRYPATFTDGTSNTILFATGYSQAVDPFSGSGPTKPRLVDRRWWDDPTWTPMPTAAAFQVAPTTQGASALLPQGFSRGGLFGKGGINVALADGSVRTLNSKVSSTTFYQVCTPNGGEVPGDDW
jgi:prepilin-type processing-associated H-X9-DG protein